MQPPASLPVLPTSAAQKAAAERDTLPRLAQLSDEVRRPFPASRKVYAEGSRTDVRVRCVRYSRSSDAVFRHGK